MNDAFPDENKIHFPYKLINIIPIIVKYFLEETFSVPIKSNHSKIFFHLLISSIAVISKVILIYKKVLQHITRYMYAPSFLIDVYY